jgi:hypothetical protein
MDEKLHTRAERLLIQATKVVDPATNGLYDREDLIRLVSSFISMLGEVLKENEQECRAMSDRLRRSPLHDPIDTHQTCENSPTV